MNTVIMLGWIGILAVMLGLAFGWIASAKRERILRARIARMQEWGKDAE